MKERVKNHHGKILKYTKNRLNGVIWIITHGLIIKQIASLIGIKMAKEFSTLTCLSIIDGDEMTKGEILLFRNDTDNTDNSDSADEIEVPS